jgi:hypothetical protein
MKRELKEDVVCLTLAQAGDQEAYVSMKRELKGHCCAGLLDCFLGCRINEKRIERTYFFRIPSGNTKVSMKRELKA